ncbi:MAG: quinoprotein dehydrogenase-associated putative ABC transporter substrate-binding protein [Acidobacteriaceae bacterium]|nr:quinoprotein dehydrogenase-associated putative ABC transporter substrate-binding protein [Acidobacteriaceae bacterium]
MFFRCLSALLLSSFAFAGPAVLRVCADPNNLPFSNQQQQGFENKLADLVGNKMDARVEYTWWPERKSLVKQTLDAGRCDVLLGVPAALDSVSTTIPYYRSTYVFVTRRDREIHIGSLADPKLAGLRIGIQIVGDDYAPPAFALARRGITDNIVGYPLFGPKGEADPQAKIIIAVERDDVDIAIVWGPLAGYFAKNADVALDIVPVTPAMYFGIPFAYDISMAVRKGDDSLRTALDRVLTSEAVNIQKILTAYGIPEVR